jgi:LysR family transcriptional regulator, regulator for bpeEF and oprC
MAMDWVRNVKIFLRVVESGSFSRTATELGIGQPTVSKAVDALEKHLGTKLLNRSTRQLVLTEDGACAVQNAQKLIDAYEDLSAIPSASATPRGILRIACPTALGSLFIIPRLRRFQEAYPEVGVDLRLSDSFVDLLAGGIDVSFRVGALTNSALLSKHVGALRRIAIGSEEYFRRHPVPKVPADLKQHACILRYPNEVWDFRGAQGPLTVAVGGGVMVDSFIGLRVAVQEGLGIGLAGMFLFMDADGMAKGLKPVLTAYEPEPLPVNILFQSGKFIPKRLRLFIDYFYEELRQAPWIVH